MTMPAMLESLLALDPRIRDAGRLHQPNAYVSVVSTANTTILTVPTGASLYLICLIVTSRQAGNVYLNVGTGAFTQVLPRLGPFFQNIVDVVWLPPVHFTTSIVVQASAAAASPNDVHILPITIAVGGA